MNSRDIFYNFILSEEATEDEFKKACKFLTDAHLHDRHHFYEKMNAIMEQALIDMIDTKANSKQIIKSIYQKYGITEDYFSTFFTLYLTSQTKNLNVEKYLEMNNLTITSIGKSLFEEAKLALWDPDVLEQIAKKHHIHSGYFKFMFWFYASHYYGIPYKDFSKYMKYYAHFHKFLNMENMSQIEKNQAFKYYQKYSSENEKKSFIEAARKYLFHFQNHIIANYDLSLFLSEFSLSLNDIYFFLTIVPNLDQDTIRIVSTQFKYYYESSLTLNFSLKKIGPVAAQHGLSAKEFVILAKAYAKEVLGNDHIEEDILAYRYDDRLSKKIYSLLDTIKDETDPEEIKKFIALHHVTAHDIHVYCYRINKNLPLDAQQSLERKLLLSLRELQSEKARNRAENRYTFYEEYVNGDANLREHCHTNDREEKIVKNQYKHLKNEELVVKFSAKMNQEKEAILYYFRLLIQNIKSGITVNGVNRKFTLFDYFYYFGQFNLHKIVLTQLPLSAREKTTLNIFFKPLSSANPLNKNVVIHSIYEYNCDKDELGFPIKGTGRIITEDELTCIVDIFLEKNIPLYDKLVSIATRLYNQNALIEVDTLQRK